MTQRTYETLGHKTAQIDRLWNFMRARLGRWIPTWRLAKVASPTGNGVALSPRSRMHDLRAMTAGSPWRIETKVQHVGQTIRSWYRLVRA